MGLLFFLFKFYGFHKGFSGFEFLRVQPHLLSHIFDQLLQVSSVKEPCDENLEEENNSMNTFHEHT